MLHDPMEYAHEYVSHKELKSQGLISCLYKVETPMTDNDPITDK